MYSLILPASLVPEGHTVYKVTGQKPYIFRTCIQMYGEQRQEITVGNGLCFLTHEGNINVIKDSMKLRLDFETLDQLEAFIDINLHSHK